MAWRPCSATGSTAAARPWWCPNRPRPNHGGTIYTDIRRDLAKFDSRFGLPAARLRVVNSIAHSKTPFLAGTEEVEDTEIIHAIAPGATLDVPILPSPAS